MCLNPYLRDRFELSNTGSFIIKDINQNIFLFLQNSIGTYLIFIFMLYYISLIKNFNENMFFRRYILSMLNT